MAETKRYGLGNLLDIEQILLEAQHRWLRPAEICEILQNYEKFSIAPEPANMPPSGSLFLFDRKVLRYFRKDGHNWRKKKDGKTIKEAHERLKAGSVDVLHCYYAHGEENENFQRRSYWMLEEELSHIVLVHYREVKGNRMQFNRLKENQEAVPYSQEAEELISNEVDSSRSSSFRQNDYQMRSLTMDTTSASGAQTSEYEDAESVYNPQASSRFHPFLELQQPAIEKIDAGFSNPCYPAPFSNDYQGKLSTIPGIDFSLNQADKVKDSNDAGLTYESRKHLDFQSWEDVLGNCTSGVESDPLQPSFISTKPDTIGHVPKQVHERLGQLFTDSPGERQNFGSQPHVSQKSEAFKYDSSHLSKQPTDQQLPSNFPYDLTSRFNEPYSSFPEKPNNVSGLNDLLMPHLNTELKPDSERNLTLDGKAIYSSAIKQHLLDGSPSEEGLRKLDSFNRWMSKELGDVNDLGDANESHMQSSSGAYWETVASENGVSDASVPSQGQLNTYMMSPSLSQDQLFSIIDFSPSWTYVGSEVKVLIMGRFLKSQQEAENCKWSCMFGEVEVFAEIIANGVLSCHAPLHEAGRVPFYVTCSNRLACSEVREFEYKVGHIRDLDKADNDGGNAIENLHVRFGKLLCSSAVFQKSDTQNVHDVSQISSKITPLLKESIDEWDQMLKVTSAQEFSPEKVKDQLLEKLLKEKLHSWLLQKVAEGGKGPNVLDEGGQGVVHLAAALGYDWALEPTILAGVNVNFRDANGWTALHWAAFSGREHTVGSLVSLGAAPGALTDPTPKYSSGSTPADLASANGHKGIAGYLAESDLSAHLSYLSLDKQGGDAAEISGTKAVQTAPERNAVPVSYEDLQQGSSLKNSLAAVCNATQAAARIHQVFRVQSFQKKQLKELGDDKFGMSDERALSLIALKTNKLAQHDEPVHAAAIRIQNKFRSWKGRKDYLIIRQRIVKIQAQWRGHQVRKNYKKIVWSVGILEKVILRWRRKGSGLRGFKSEALNDDMQDTSLREDDDDFFKEGRKQTEERLQKALARVKSMVQYPEARDQYHRLLNVVTEIQETKADKLLNSSEETIYLEDDLVDIEALLDDDTLMPTAS